MNKEWCSYSKKAPGIQWNTLENLKTREMMLLQFKIIALSGYDVNS